MGWKTAKLVLRDSVIVGVAGCAPWLGIFAVVWTYGELFIDDFWIDRGQHIVDMAKAVAWCVLIGSSLGLLSSLPARIPRRGVGFAACCAAILTLIGIARSGRRGKDRRPLPACS